MSSIGSDPHLGLAGLDRLGGQVALDDLQRQHGQPAAGEAAALRETAAPAPAAAEVDFGERLLAADAWSAVPAGSRTLPGDLAFEHALGGQELSAAADQATDAVLAALG